MNNAKVVEKFEAAQNALVLQSSDLSLETIAQMVDSGAIDAAPKYQRRERWKQHAQSELIESFLLNVPVPPVYLAEDDFGTYSVIDGKQRITTIHNFLRNNFALDGLVKFPEVDGAKFADLPKPLQNALSIRPYLRVVTLLKQTDPQLKYEVFTRLNTGGEPLLPQEIRNALYRGPFNDLLFELGESPFLRRHLKIKTTKETPYKEMQDVEAVLRFLCISVEWGVFSGDMRRPTANKRPSSHGQPKPRRWGTYGSNPRPPTRWPPYGTGWKGTRTFPWTFATPAWCTWPTASRSTVLPRRTRGIFRSTACRASNALCMYWTNKVLHSRKLFNNACPCSVRIDSGWN